MPPESPPVPEGPPMDQQHDRAQWRVHFRRDAYAADIDAYRTLHGKEEGERRFFAEHAPVDTVEGDENILTYGGVSNLWQCLIGNGTAAGGAALTFFNNANANIGVGDSATAEVATQTDLLAATNKARQAMDATYPQHTDGTTSASNTITFKATFGTAAANFTWAEWIVANAATGGRALNRKVQALGAKTSAASWSFTVTVTIT